MYRMSCTRLDIAYSVSKLSSYMSNPRVARNYESIKILKVY